MREAGRRKTAGVVGPMIHRTRVNCTTKRRLLGVLFVEAGHFTLGLAILHAVLEILALVALVLALAHAQLDDDALRAPLRFEVVEERVERRTFAAASPYMASGSSPERTISVAKVSSMPCAASPRRM